MDTGTDAALDQLRTLGVAVPERGADSTRQRALLERLLAAGATVDDLAAATREHRLESLSVELAVHEGPRLTLAEVAEAADATVEDALRLWRSWGFPAPRRDDRRFGERDVDLVRFALAIEALVGRESAYHTARVMGTALGRVVEAEIAMVRATLEAPLRQSGCGRDGARGGLRGHGPDHARPGRADARGAAPAPPRGNDAPQRHDRRRQCRRRRRARSGLAVFAVQQRVMATVIGTTSLFHGASGPTKDLDLENFGLLAEVFRQEPATGEIDAGRDPVQLAEVVNAVLVLTITNWVTGWWGDVGPLERRLAAAVDVVLDGCVAT